ncbi:carboxymuconolactone decarboxylase family protein [Streptomyces bauhiniae]|uniref:Carboxymuconolactone decarboxylase family protein n=1 Tax=Streptomyces bauhiniae TaxID=2340725 RepID=A0A7K3QUD1_9ACTN|nr:carboxymuconolactone decarboxylase family protein [Streptomyces bauhiniae]NEB93507.1 carboxymuconolactone decarboxylase family protein [Streptomyces bauhiniae]
MRLSPVSPATMTDEQRRLHDDIRAGVGVSYAQSRTENEQGDLIGPFPAWLHDPDLGTAAWRLNRALSTSPVVPAGPREVATLVIGAHFRAAFEVGSHRHLGRQAGLSDAVVDALASGRRPEGLTDEERCAGDVAQALCAGGELPGPLYERAVELFGERGTIELVHVCGFYSLTCMVLNAFDVPPSKTE